MKVIKMTKMNKLEMMLESMDTYEEAEVIDAIICALIDNNNEGLSIEELTAVIPNDDIVDNIICHAIELNL